MCLSTFERCGRCSVAYVDPLELVDEATEFEHNLLQELISTHRKYQLVCVTIVEG